MYNSWSILQNSYFVFSIGQKHLEQHEGEWMMTDFWGTIPLSVFLGKVFSIARRFVVSVLAFEDQTKMSC